MTELDTTTEQGARRVTRNTSGVPLLQVDNLSVDFPAPHQPGGVVHAVRGISYQVHEGEFLGIVGESGSGKSVSSMGVIGLLPSSARVRGASNSAARSWSARATRRCRRCAAGRSR
ncbi:hypothetical protein GCM10027613_30820 [Microlunatus endophyticus]